MWSAGRPGVGGRHIPSAVPILSVAVLTRTRASCRATRPPPRGLPCLAGVRRQRCEFRLRQGLDHRRERDLLRSRFVASRRTHGPSLRQGNGSHPRAACLCVATRCTGSPAGRRWARSTISAAAMTGASPNSWPSRTSGRACADEVGEAEARRVCVAIPDAPDDPCTVDAFGPVAGSGDALAFQLQSYTNPKYRSGGGVVVFRRHGTMLTPVIATAVEDVTFGTPVVVQSAAGKLLNLPGMMAGTGAFNAGALYLMDGEKLERDRHRELAGRSRQATAQGLGCLEGHLPRLRQAHRGHAAVEERRRQLLCDRRPRHAPARHPERPAGDPRHDDPQRQSRRAGGLIRGSRFKALLTLRSARSARLEGWATPRLVSALRDAALRAAPQGEVLCATQRANTACSRT